MTEKLFEKDAYQKEAKAVVEQTQENKIVLDRTILFAFSGGQQSDSGTINRIRVIDSAKDGELIWHELEQQPSFGVGDEVDVVLDWEKRYALMKLHSATHIVYYFLMQKIKIEKLIGSNLHSEKARIDFISAEPVTPLVSEIEALSNELISQEKEIRTWEDEEKKGKFWWEIEGLGKMPCGGTHPKNTKEIGKIKLKRKNIGAGKERIEIKLVD